MREMWKRFWLLPALCVAIVAPHACAQPGRWETFVAAGDEAYQRGDYAEAEKSWLAALKEAQNFRPEDPRLGASLNDLAMLYATQGKYAEAEPLYNRALAIAEEALGPEDPAVAACLGNLAGLYRTQGKYAEAEPLSNRALAIVEKARGPEHPDVAESLNNLALLYFEQGKYTEAEPLYKRALAIREEALGPAHPRLATSLNNLADLYT